MTDGPRLRIAPSPTGFFHVGTAHTALFNWLYARQKGGTFVLRIEDTDTSRNRPEHVEGILRAMSWLGLDWDEGPYFQSQRGSLYAEAIDRLVASKAVYACACPSETIGGCDCRGKDLEPIPGYLLRFRTPDAGQTSFEDVIRGTVTFDNAKLEDFAVRKSNGDPLFLLANVVDDDDMSITHVIRGEDHVSNTPKYLLLWEALGYGPRPVFAHLPLLLNDARQKLSKRRDKVALEQYRDEGYLPEAMVNYLALLGWSPGDDREILTIDELVAQFRLEDVKSSPAFFDLKKLSSVNSEYIRALPEAAFVARSQAWLAERWTPLAPLVQERARTLADAYAMAAFVFLPEPPLDAAAWEKGVRQQPAFETLLAAALEAYAECEWDAATLKDVTLAVGEKAGVPQLGKAQSPIRLAVTGRSVGPPLFESLVALGREQTLARLRAAQSRLEGSPAG